MICGSASGKGTSGHRFESSHLDISANQRTRTVTNIRDGGEERTPRGLGRMRAHRETLGHWLLQRSTAAFSVLITLTANVSTPILLNILLFRHIHIGIEEILADYVNHGVTRNWISILLRIFLLVIIKDVFLFLVLN